ncbi:hypothetical protein IJI99_00775 [bacterium]|nr:hypothetical protein [bacterium]
MSTADAAPTQDKWPQWLWYVFALIAILALLGGFRLYRQSRQPVLPPATVYQSADQEDSQLIYDWYEIESIQASSGEQVTDFSLLRSLGLNLTLLLRPDGTGVLNTYGEETDFTYDDQNFAFAGGQPSAYEFDGERIYLTNQADQMVFVRASSDSVSSNSLADVIHSLQASSEATTP